MATQMSSSDPSSTRATKIPSDPARDVELQQHGSETSPDVGDDALLPTVAKNDIVYLSGMKFWMLTFSLAVMVFMVTFEIPVVTTSLVAITDSLGGFDNVSWIVTSYLLGYVAPIIVFAKLSDIFGRKPIYVVSILFFLIFSAACSAAQTMTQLIVFRAFQGIGGGSCYSMGTVIISELVPQAQYAAYTARLSMAVSLALLVGPIIGGVISEHTTWRWIFIINVPISALCLVLAVVGMPNGFPLRQQNESEKPGHEHGHLPLFSRATLDRVDIPGSLLLLLAVLSLTAGFEEAGALYPWRSAYVITLLVVSGFLWIALALWERRVTRKDGPREAVLPWRFFTNRVMVGILLVFVLLGGPFMVAVFQLPQRFQLVNGLSGLDGGVRLIPFTFASPVGTGIAAGMATKFKVPPIFVILTGSTLQIIGFALLGTLPATTELLPRTYGYEVIAGFGCGMNLALLFVMIPQVVELRDQAVALGSGSQFRMMGSAIAIAIATSVFNSYTGPRLADLVGQSSTGSSSLAGLSQTLNSLPPAAQTEVRLVLARGYNWQMIVLCACAAGQIPAALLLWRKNQIRL